MPYYVYRQTNSGGFFEGPAPAVVVEAPTAADADDAAEGAGVYFEPRGFDCPGCCGERWRRAREEDAIVMAAWAFAYADDPDTLLVVASNAIG
jgi:hypothetical protein